MTSLVTLDEVRAVVETSLGDVDLGAVIDREEAWLATRIGALSGERTVTYWPGVLDWRPVPERERSDVFLPGTDGPLFLSRRTTSVVVTDAGVSVAAADLRFVPDSGLIRRLRGYWAGPVTVAFSPADTAEVKRVVIELVRGTLSETGHDAESIGDYSYTRGTAVNRLSRPGLVRGILLRRPVYSVRLRSSVEPP